MAAWVRVHTILECEHTEYFSQELLELTLFWSMSTVFKEVQCTYFYLMLKRNLKDMLSFSALQ